MLTKENDGAIFKLFKGNEDKTIGVVYFEKDRIFPSRYKYGGMSLSNDQYGKYTFIQGYESGQKSLNIMYGKNNGKKMFMEFTQGSKKVIDEIQPSEYFMKIYREIGSKDDILEALMLKLYDENMKDITSEFYRK